MSLHGSDYTNFHQTECNICFISDFLEKREPLLEEVDRLLVVPLEPCQDRKTHERICDTPLIPLLTLESQTFLMQGPRLFIIPARGSYLRQVIQRNVRSNTITQL